MLKNYFKIAFRNLAGHKIFSFINIAGLAIGIASCILLFTVIRYELSYDKFQPNYDRIYHVVTENKFSDGITYNPGISFPALSALRLTFPKVPSGALLASYGSQVTVLDGKDLEASVEKKFIEPSGFFFADAEFFKIFQYDWVAGSPSVLDEPNNTLLTQSMAAKYFGSSNDALGKYLKLDNSLVVKVAGIIKDPPANTDFPLKIVTSLITAKARPDVYYRDDWNSTNSDFQVFVLLPENMTQGSMDQQLKGFSDKFNKQGGPSNSIRTNFLQPLSTIHFDKRFINFGSHVTSKSTLWTLSLIGLFIIVMACINFINLSTAQAAGRSKEIGVRKVLGGNRRQLFGQIILETSMVVLASVLLALVIAKAGLPFIKNIALITEELTLLNFSTIFFLVLLAIVIIFFAGTYPAIILSGFKPALALKNKISSAGVGGISLRRGLVVIQFAISQFLIIGTLVAISQMSFVKNADLGFEKEAVLLFNTKTDSRFHLRSESFKQALLQMPGVKAVSYNFDVPSSENGWYTNFSYDHRPSENFQVSIKYGDEDYIKTFGLQLIAGRDFTKSDTTNEVVVNETLLRDLGIKNPEDALGKDLKIGSGAWKKIAGVVKDFKTSSLRDAIKPVVICEKKDFYGVTAVKLQSSNIEKTKAAIETQWNRFFPEYAFSTSFMEDAIEAFYKQEEQLELLYKIFAGIAIFISCLGLYGLVSFMAVQKTKEIGIRKVLGASVKSIVLLFSKEFTLLIFIGSLVAIPVSWLVMNHWLQNFTFRIHIGPGIFILSVFILIIVAWMAVGYKSIRAALVNPARSLKSE